MKIHTIEIAAAIEEEIRNFLKEWGGGYPMRFTRFIDLGGRQTDLHVYKAEKNIPPWMVIRIKSVMKTEQGECIQYFVRIIDSDKTMEEVLVSPEIWKLPALADRVLNFSRNDLLAKIGSEGGAIEEGERSLQSPERPSSSEEDDDGYGDLDTSGILAGGDSAVEMDFNPEDVIAQANSADDIDPAELIRQQNEEGDDDDDDEGESGFNPEDVIKE